MGDQSKPTTTSRVLLYPYPLRVSRFGEARRSGHDPARGYWKRAAPEAAGHPAADPGTPPHASSHRTPRPPSPTPAHPRANGLGPTPAHGDGPAER